MDPHPCTPSRGEPCGCGHSDLRAPARRGLFWASLLCLAGALASTQLADRATDDVHRVMFGTLAGALGVAAAVLLVVRTTMRLRGSP